MFRQYDVTRTFCKLHYEYFTKERAQLKNNFYFLCVSIVTKAFYSYNNEFFSTNAEHCCRRKTGSIITRTETFLTVRRVQRDRDICLSSSPYWWPVWQKHCISAKCTRLSSIEKQLLFLPGGFSFSQAQRNQISRLLLPIYTSWNSNDDSSGSLRDDTKRRNPY